MARSKEPERRRLALPRTSAKSAKTAKAVPPAKTAKTGPRPTESAPRTALPVSAEPFRIGVVPGVDTDKWLARWRERHPAYPIQRVEIEDSAGRAPLDGGEVDMALLRRPETADYAMSRVPLYTEVTVVLFGAEHFFAASDPREASDALTVADLASEKLWIPSDDTLGLASNPAAPPIAVPLATAPLTTAVAVAAVAAGVGILLLPASIARLHQRKDVLTRPVTGTLQSTIALTWLTDRESDADGARYQEFAGITRGRTARSSRNTLVR